MSKPSSADVLECAGRCGVYVINRAYCSYCQPVGHMLFEEQKRVHMGISDRDIEFDDIPVAVRNLFFACTGAGLFFALGWLAAGWVLGSFHK